MIPKNIRTHFYSPSERVSCQNSQPAKVSEALQIAYGYCSCNWPQSSATVGGRRIIRPSERTFDERGRDPKFQFEFLRELEWMRPTEVECNLLGRLSSEQLTVSVRHLQILEVLANASCGALLEMSVQRGHRNVQHFCEAFGVVSTPFPQVLPAFDKVLLGRNV